MRKLFLAFMAIATIAMVGCKPKNEPQPIEEDDPTPVTEKEDAPMLSNPAAGFVTIALRVPATTPGQVYAIGSFANANGEDNKWSHAKDFFTKVEGTETWHQITLTYAADMTVKVCAIPAVGNADWSYQWGMNTEEKENVTIVSGDVTLDNSENDGEVKALNLVDGKVVFIDVDAWKTNPANKKGKATVAAIKYAPDWVFKPMEAKGDGVFTFDMVYTENGVNIADNLEGLDANWYPTENIENYTESGVASGDSVRFTFTSESGSVGVVRVDVIEKGEQNPPIDPVIITVKAKMPAGWTETPTAWVWPDGGDGAVAQLTQEGDWWVYTTPEAVPGLNIIYRNGADWNGEANQTVDLHALTNMCWELASDGVAKATATDVDCE